jgi:thiol-disulfide isomerase/thioredoxin
VLSISLGPLALPVAPLVLIGALLVATTLARRLGGAPAENAIWLAALFGLVAARVAHVASHAGPYLAAPWALLDVRDGGWAAPAGFGVAAAWLGWRAWRTRHDAPLRRALAVAAGTGVALWVAGQGALQVAGQLAGSGPGTPAPAVALVSLDGTRSTTLPAALAGRPAVVNLWASWCAPCRVEMPVLAAAQQQRRDVAFLFVNQGEAAAAVQAYLAREGLALEQVWLDRSSALGPAVGSAGLPTTLFYDSDGRLVDAHFGVLNAAALQARMEALRTP